MGNNKKCSHFLIFVLVYITFCFCVDNMRCECINKSESNCNKLSNFIYDLDYNRDEVLVYKGESVEVTKKEGNLDNSNNFIVIARERKSISNGKADIGVLTSSEHRTYPGSLLLANYRLLDNNPDILSVERDPITYRVNLPGLTNEGTFRIIPSFPRYQEALQGVLKTWFDNYGEDSITAKFQSDYTFAHSKSQMLVKFGMSFKNTDVESSIDFSAVDKNEKLILINKFQQNFYTVSVTSPHKPADLFGSTVTVEDLKAKNVKNENPPILVDSVSYGRTIFVKIETTSTSKEAKALLEARLTKLNTGVNSEIDYSDLLDNFKMEVYVMGGGTEHVELINARTMKDVNDIIVRYRNFNRRNNGYPIVYSTEFLKDNSRAVVQSSTEYTETIRTEHQYGIIRLKQAGWFVGRFKVEWDEISYDNYGNEIRTRKGWDKNCNQLTSVFVTEIQLGGNCQNISVFADEATGLVWEPWRTVIDLKGISLINKRSFAIWGTTLGPLSTIEPPI